MGRKTWCIIFRKYRWDREEKSSWIIYDVVALAVGKQSALWRKIRSIRTYLAMRFVVIIMAKRIGLVVGQWCYYTRKWIYLSRFFTLYNLSLQPTNLLWSESSFIYINHTTALQKSSFCLCLLFITTKCIQRCTSALLPAWAHFQLPSLTT